jgi:hypothetical protein
MAHSDRRSATRLGKVLTVARQRALKLAANLFSWRLDAELAAGADPRRRALLRARVAELVAPNHRRRAATSLLRLGNEADAVGSRPLSAAVPISRDQVAYARDALAFAAQVLLFAEQVDARGVAMIDQLLRDGGSVLYVGGEPGALEARLDEALHHLVSGKGRPDADPGQRAATHRGFVGRR